MGGTLYLQGFAGVEISKVVISGVGTGGTENPDLAVSSGIGGLLRLGSELRLFTLQVNQSFWDKLHVFDPYSLLLPEAHCHPGSQAAGLLSRSQRHGNQSQNPEMAGLKGTIGNKGR